MKKKDPYRIGKRAYMEEWRAKNPIKQMLCILRSRAKKKGVEFGLTERDLFIPKICPVLGIPLVPSAGSMLHNGAIPSVDRIDPSKGYVPGNVKVISHRANSIKHNATGAEILLVANYVLAEEASRG